MYKGKALILTSLLFLSPILFSIYWPPRCPLNKPGTLSTSESSHCGSFCPEHSFCICSNCLLPLLHIFAQISLFSELFLDPVVSQWTHSYTHTHTHTHTHTPHLGTHTSFSSSLVLFFSPEYLLLNKLYNKLLFCYYLSPVIRVYSPWGQELLSIVFINFPSTRNTA